MRRRNKNALLRLAVVLCILLCLAVVTAAVAHADSEGAGTVTASALNMRSEPSTASSVVTCLPRGRQVTTELAVEGSLRIFNAEAVTVPAPSLSAWATAAVTTARHRRMHNTTARRRSAFLFRLLIAHRVARARSSHTLATSMAA